MTNRKRWILTALLVMALAGISLAIAGSDVTVSGTVPRGDVTLDMERLPDADCWFQVGNVDDDGRPGGSRTPEVQVFCPDDEGTEAVTVRM